MGNATGLFNMLRNIGGSIGISMATTALIRRAAMHQTELGATSPSNMVLQQKSAPIAGYLGHQIGPAQARPGSLGLIYGLMEQQSALMAYVDVFRWTALLAFFCAAAAWLFKKPEKHAAAARGALSNRWVYRGKIVSLLAASTILNPSACIIAESLTHHRSVIQRCRPPATFGETKIATRVLDHHSTSDAGPHFLSRVKRAGLSFVGTGDGGQQVL